MPSDLKKLNQVLVILGSDSDRQAMQSCFETLGQLGILHRIEVSSAHRQPERTRLLAREAEKAGVQVIITAAGLAAHLPGVVKAETILPVIGVPLAVSPLNGIDALYSMVQMPKGVPVATMALASSGAINAALLAGEILAINDPVIRQRLLRWKNNLARGHNKRSYRVFTKKRK